MRKIHIAACLAAALTLTLAAGPALAQGAQHDETPHKDIDDAQMTDDDKALHEQMQHPDRVMHYDRDDVFLAVETLERMALHSEDEEHIGEVAELVLTPDMREVDYVVVKLDESVDADGQWTAVEWESIKGESGDDALTLAVARDEVQEAPTFDADEWPVEVEEDWIALVDTDADMEYDTVIAVDNPEFYPRRSSNIIGMTVATRDGAAVGRISDLAISRLTGAATFAIVQYGAWFEDEDDRAAIPMGALTFDVDDKTAYLSASEETLEEAAYKGERPDLSTKEYVEGAYENFDADVWWIKE